MGVKPKWDSKSAGEYERSLKPKEMKKEEQPKREWVGLTDEEMAVLWKEIGRAHV